MNRHYPKFYLGKLQIISTPPSIGIARFLVASWANGGTGAYFPFSPVASVGALPLNQNIFPEPKTFGPIVRMILIILAASWPFR